MNAQRAARAVIVSVWCLLLLPVATWAQGLGTGAIAGVVRDTSGAVLPGVTVEAASPALIEKVRTVVTDGQGLYRIVDLRPGAYVVTFNLSGFSTFRREGIELTTAFTATVNAELKVGALEETVTVSGAAPVVDTQNVLQQQTLARATLDALPTTKRVGSYATLLAGAVTGQQDVGGLIGERGTQFAVHGQRLDDHNVSQDGMNLTNFNGSGYSWNPHNTQEIVLETSGISAEASAGGVRVNIVQKDGGNTFSGSFNTIDSHPDMQSGNLTDALRARGLFATPSVRRLYDVGGALGGPLKRDRLWFFTAHRKWVASRYIPGLFYNKAQSTCLGTDPVWCVEPYTADLSRPAYTNDYYEDHSLRLTWQASPKDKVAGNYAPQFDCNCPIDDLALGTVAPEAAGDHHYQPNWIGTVSWSRPATNRLLFEAGTSASFLIINAKKKPEVAPNGISIVELSNNLQYGARGSFGLPSGYSTWGISHLFSQRFAVSYVTGSHTFKTGVEVKQLSRNHTNENAIDMVHGARLYTFRNQVPLSVTLYATPHGERNQTMAAGAYAQDQWTMRKLTLNLGVRYDGFNGSVPAQSFAAGYFVPARDFPAVKDSPKWKNLSPRLGAAYDLFGTGRTAAKVSLGRYPSGAAGNLSIAQNQPVLNQARNATRTWNDANGNYVPDCVLGPSVPGANGECGRLSDLTFGQVTAGNTRYADDALRGFNDSQAYNWQGSVSVQQELRPGTALNVGYFWTWYGNFRVTDNQLVPPANYDPYCITAPVDSRLPSTISGSQVCGLYDVTPTLFGKVDNLVTQASHYGTQTEVYSGVDVTLNARFGQGGQVSGGLSVGRTVTDNCFQNSNPSLLASGASATSPRTQAFCHVSPPWSAGTQVKFLVVYPLPWHLQTSAIYQNIPGIPITATYVATNAQIAPSLGRNLAAGANATATIDLIPRNTLFEDRFQQVDLRFARIFRIGKVRLEGNVDLYNLFNASPVLTINTRYGSQWLNARQILPGRLLKLGAQLSF